MNASQIESGGYAANANANANANVKTYVNALTGETGTDPRHYVEIRTHENVTIRYETAGLGSRYLASLIDLLIRGAFWVIVLLIIAFAVFHGNVTEIQGTMEASTENLMYLIIVGYFAVLLGRFLYFGLFETLWSGRTPGKRAVRIRAVSVTGESASFSQIAARTLMRFLHLIPGGEALDGLFAFFSRKRQRLGDMAAGTMVIKLGRRTGADVWNAAPESGPKDADDAGSDSLSSEDMEKTEEDEGQNFGRVSDQTIAEFLREMHEAAEGKHSTENAKGQGPDAVAAAEGPAATNNGDSGMPADAENVSGFVPEGAYLTLYETRMLGEYLTKRRSLSNKFAYDRRFVEYVFRKSGQQRPSRLKKGRTYSFLREVLRYHEAVYRSRGEM